MCLFWQNLEIVMVFTFYGKNFGQIFPIFFMKPAAGAKFLHWLGGQIANSSAENVRTLQGDILDIPADKIQSF